MDVIVAKMKAIVDNYTAVSTTVVLGLEGVCSHSMDGICCSSPFGRCSTNVCGTRNKSKPLPPREHRLSFFDFEGAKSDKDNDTGDDVDFGAPTGYLWYFYLWSWFAASGAESSSLCWRWSRSAVEQTKLSAMQRNSCLTEVAYVPQTFSWFAMELLNIVHSQIFGNDTLYLTRLLFYMGINMIY
jgi:hypothetical protein